MPGPTPNYTTVQVRGSYAGTNGVNPEGQVLFEADAIRLIDTAAKITILPGVIAVPLVNGAFAVDIPVTDDPDINSAGFTYKVTELFSGGKSYHIEVPISAVGTGIDISDVVPADISTGIGTEVTRTEFNALADSVTRTVVVPQGTGTPSAEPDGTLWIEYIP